MIGELLVEIVADSLLSPVFDRITGRGAAAISLVGCVFGVVLWWQAETVLGLVLAGLFGAAAVVSLVQSRAEE